MAEVSVHDAKTHLSRLLVRVAGGEEIVITRAGRPVARLVAVRGEERDRIPDEMKGRVRISEDFDAPLPEDLLESFLA